MQTIADWKQPFAEKLHLLMSEKGWTQAELARRACIGKDCISRYMSGKHAPAPSHLKKIADVFSVSPSVFFPPSTVESDVATAYPVEFRMLRDDPTQAVVKIDKILPTDVALQIVTLANHSKSS